MREAIRKAVSQRDSAGIKKLKLAQAEAIADIIETAGTPEASLKTLEGLKRPEVAALRTVLARLKESCPGTAVTLDPLEFRGFGYHQGISFSIFAKGLRHELGRGGRYETENETATGFTLYVTHLLDLLPAPAQGQRVLVPAGYAEAAKLREQGWITVNALADGTKTEAAKLGCSHFIDQGALKKI